jgi:hypothetical protein
MRTLGVVLSHAEFYMQAQEDIFRKWILGGQDRKLWIPSHSYR